MQEQPSALRVISTGDKPAPSSPRRLSVKGSPGVYYRPLPGGRRRYEITYTDGLGIRRWQVVDGDLEAANAARDEIRGRRRRGELVTRSKITIGELLDEWLGQVHGLRPQTRALYSFHVEHNLRPNIGTHRVDKFGKADLLRLIRSMEADNYSGHTIRGALTPLRGAMDYAVEQGIIAANPYGRLKRKERPKVKKTPMRILESDEIARLLKAAPGEKQRVLLAVAIFTGVRQSEQLGLTWADVKLEQETVTVSTSIHRFASTRRCVRVGGGDG